MAHIEITQIQRFIGDGSDKPTTGVPPGSIYYETGDSITKYRFDGTSWVSEEAVNGGD